MRAELGIGTDAPLVVYAGSVGARYDTRAIGEFALELRKLRPDTRLVVLSGSPETARAELLDPLPELREFTSITRVGPDEVPRYLACADIGTAFIRSSFSTLGISPVKTGEYLLCGLPIVGTAEVGDNAAPIAEGVFFDKNRGLDAAARWAAESVLPNRDEYRERARAAGVAQFSLSGSVGGYLTALDHLRREIERGRSAQLSR